MVNAQEWLNKEYPLNQRAGKNFLDISRGSGWAYDKKLTGTLDLSDFVNLVRLECSNNQLTSLNISKCKELSTLICHNNNLTNLDLNNCPELFHLDCSRNLLRSLDISNNLKLTHLVCNDGINPIKQLSQKIQDQEKTLTELKANETTNHQKITDLETELQQLKNLKENLAKQFQAKEELLKKSVGDLTIQLEQIKTEKNDLITKLKTHETNLTDVRSLLDKANLELTNKKQELIDLEKDFQLHEEGEYQTYQNYQDKINGLEETINNQIKQLATKTEELNDLKAQFGVKDEIIKNKEQEILTQHQEIVIKNGELNQVLLLRADYQIKKTKISELESQLTGLVLGSGLLVKQVEDLTNQLSTSQLAEQSAKLEKEIKENLLAAKENELKAKDSQISQQATKLNSYQQIIRNSEDNLAKVQDIILAKTESLEKLEEERNNLEEELEQAQEKIKQLETTLLNSQTQINQLETKIKDLENDNSNQTELDKLRKQLVQEQNNHQQLKTQSHQQIAQLQNELTQLKNKEAQLSLKIKELTTKQEVIKEEILTTSLWTKIRTPLLIFGGIGIIFIAYKLIRSKLKN